MDPSSSPPRQVAIIMNVNKSFDRRIIAGIARYARAARNWSFYLEDDISARFPNLAEWRGDGIIADLDDERTVKLVANAGVPVVGTGGGAGGHDPSGPISYVASDDLAAGAMGYEHLASRGYRRFAYCGTPKSWISLWSETRGKGFEREAKKHGYPCAMFTGKQANAKRWEAMQAELTAWIDSLEKPFGLMACDDVRARHVLEAARRLKIRIPEDMAVLGVDNDEMMCELADPPLSSVVLGTDEIGFRAAELLDKAMTQKKTKSRTIRTAPVGVVTRRSTDTLAVEDAEVSAAMRFIREHVGQRLQVRDILEHVQLSRSTLDQRFKESLRHTVHDEIRRVQVARAKELLAGTELSLKEVAERAGYNNVQYMTMVFRRDVGPTPAEYRRSPR